MQSREVTDRALSGLLLAECSHGIDEEHLGNVEASGQLSSPVVADIDVVLSMRLHEQQSATGRGDVEFFDDSARSVLLLGRGIDQDVAVRQQSPQGVEVAAGRRGFVRVGIGAVDDDDVAQDCGINRDDIELLDRQSERRERGLRMCE